MPQTSEISSAVGTTWNNIEVSRKDIPLSKHKYLSVSRIRDCRTHLLCSSIYSSGQSSRIPAQVELDIQIQEMTEDVPCYSADGALRYVCEDCVAKLRE